jgi:translocation and assembly module TamB
MKPGKRWAIRVSVIVGVVVVAVVVVRGWVIPSVLTKTLSARLHGQARVGNWWLGRSAGVEGLSLREGDAADSPEWLSARRVATDLSFAGLFRGRFAPQQVTIDGARLLLRFAKNGDLLTKGPFSGGSPADVTTLPDVDITDAEVTIDQEGRPPMVVHGVSGRLDRSADGEVLALTSDDPTWGRWTVDGRFHPDFKAGSVRLVSGPGFATDPDRNARIPFVPTEVWSHCAPTGPIGVAVTFTLAPADGRPLGILTEVTLRETTTDLHSLGVIASGVTGKIAIEDGQVRLTDLAGKALSGTLAASGVLNLAGASPRFDITLSLAKIDVAATPASWQLQEVGATGRLTGKVHLLIALAADGADLSGSSGEAVIENATVQGFPVKSLSLAMHAVGSDLQFDTKPEKTSARPFLNPRALLAASLVAFQAPEAKNPPAQPRFRLPESITTKIELEDVDLALLLARLEALTRIKVPVPIAGHLALKADAKIPLGHLTDLKGYTINGRATLTRASIDGVDLGRVSSRFDLDGGVLVLDELQGQLVERPDGGADRPPPETPPLPPDAPLIPGAFRGKLRAELSPPGKLTASFDANELPLGELAAPYTTRPTPVAGRLSTRFDASAEIGNLGSARAWSAKGRLESRQVSYQGAVLDAISTAFTIERGQIELPDLAAKLDGHPLKSHVKLDMDGARAFSADLDVTDWAIEHVFALIPHAPSPAPASGLIDGHLSVVGTLLPLVFRSEGKAEVRGMVVESVPLGDVVATWATVGDEIQIKEFQARPFSGRLDGRAAIPITAGRPIRVLADFSKIDTAELSSTLAKDTVKLVGLASGRVSATIPTDLKALKVELSLTSPSLSVQGIPTGKVLATVVGKGELLEYELTADGPNGKVRFKGNFPLSGRPEDRAANAELQAAGFTLSDIWSLLGIKGAPTQLLGRAAIDANLRARPETSLALGIHGNVEVRDLRWGQVYPLGNLRGVLAKTPASFRLDSLRGDLLGGAFSGIIWGDTPADGRPGMNFELETNRALLSRVFAFSPMLVKKLEGYGTVRVNGRMDETLRATAEVSVSQARFAGIPLADLRVPAELSIDPASGNGLLQARRWSVRLAGGRVQGSSTMKVGVDRSFNVDLGLTDIDVGTIARVESNAARPGSGKVSGKISINGPDPTHPQRFRGRIELGLSDASLGDVPVIRELGRFLGAAQGGAFEAGDLLATIANGQIAVDQLTLEGRILQIHATGSVSFSGGLDLAVLVNTNQLIPQTGQALVSIIPGLRNGGGRNDEAMLRVSNYLSTRLLKFRVGGTLKNPSVALDPGAAVGQAATGFFAGVLKLPLGLVK